MGCVVPAWPVAMNFIVATYPADCGRSGPVVGLHRHKKQVKVSLMTCPLFSYWDMMYVQRTNPMGHYSVRDVYLHVCPS